MDLAEINERLDEPHGHECGKSCWKLAHEDAPALAGEVERLRAMEARVRAEHERCTDQSVGLIPGAVVNPYCRTCMTNCPCPTIRTLDAPVVPAAARSLPTPGAGEEPDGG